MDEWEDKMLMHKRKAECLACVGNTKTGGGDMPLLLIFFFPDTNELPIQVLDDECQKTITFWAKKETTSIEQASCST
ncbi:predicted protein [Lichtheimia corymbifera JMRC:FSU:9682]|uniref:Uncharacterized protein n=1 Tax=Lichtheimia corymbifera JMRC:FSU:9682 TaxID=1263082 RepID=A0A068SDP1_9FUNG|nr:predicted protein [Lichtheimia corymbifera JMRC:FSU:9682]